MADPAPAKAGARSSPAGRRDSKAMGSGRRRCLPAFLPLLLAACTSVQLPAGSAPLDPVAFFTGRTIGEGRLDTIVSRPVIVSVRSEGTPIPGGLRLVQVITEGSKAPRTRTWTIGSGSQGVRLTDATGEVVMVEYGPRVMIAYETPGGLKIHQQLALQPDGRTVLNRLEAYKYGIRVAVLEETIRKAVAK